MADLNRLSTKDLEAYIEGRLEDMSSEGLEVLAAPEPESQGFLEQKVPFTDTAIGDVRIPIPPLATGSRVMLTPSPNQVLKGLERAKGQVGTAFGLLTSEGREQAAGTIREAGSAIAADPLGAAGHVALGAVNRFTDIASDPMGEFAKDPLGVGLEVGTAPGAGIANPLKSIPTALSGLAKGAGRLGLGTASAGAGFLSRTGAGTPSKVFKAGQEGGELAATMRATRRKRVPPPQAKKDILDAAGKLKTKGSAADKKNLQSIIDKAKITNDPRYAISMREVRSELDDILSDFKVEGGADAVLGGGGEAFKRVFGGSVGDMRTIQKVVRLIDDRVNFTNIEEVLALRQTLDTMRKKAMLVGNTRGDAFAKRVREAVDEKLKKVPGMKERDLLVTERMTLLDDVVKGLANPASTNETVAKKMASLLKDSIGERKRLIDELQEFSDVPLEGRALGLGTQVWEPQTLVAITAGVGALSWNPFLFGAIPFTSPRLMAEIFDAAGSSARVIEAAVKDATRITRLAKAANIATKGLTYGMVGERLRKRGRGSDIAGELQGRLKSRRLSEENTPDFSGLQRQR